MIVQLATDPQAWDDFLKAQRFSPFLQCWTMGDVYRDIGQEPIRLEVRDDGKIVGICQAILVPARRGRHIMVQYGPIASDQLSVTSYQVFEKLVNGLKEEAQKHSCSFIRMSPFSNEQHASSLKGINSPLHLLAEHIWYLPLKTHDTWNKTLSINLSLDLRKEEEILMSMRKTTRNLIRRAEKDGVTVELSTDPIRDVEEFIKLHDETRKRHGFTPYTNSFFRAQVQRFAPTEEVLVYIARHEGQVLATSIHMQFGGETSYHHGASVLSKVPASYLLQWRAIQDALKRGDTIYNFWGIAPMGEKKSENPDQETKQEILNPKHPFAGVTLFKTGFGGNLLNLEHCFDLPLSQTYYLTRAFEFVRKWKRGF